MLIPTKIIQYKTLWLGPFAVLVVWLAFTFCVPAQTLVAQGTGLEQLKRRRDAKFREFDRNKVHSPREMARGLNYLFLSDKKNPFGDIDPEKLKKLSELGKNFMENLSDEEKKQAQAFAEKFMKDKGLDSPEGKLLMDSLGVSPEMQSELAKEFGDNDSDNLERFQDLFKNSPLSDDENQNSQAGRDGNSKSGDDSIPRGSSARSNGSEKGMAGKRGMGKRESGGGESGGDSISENAKSKNSARDLFDSLPNELGAPEGNSSSDFRGELSKGQNSNGNGKEPRDSDANPNGKSDADNLQANNGASNPNQSPNQSSNQPNNGKRGQGKSGAEPLEHGWEGGDGPDGDGKGLAEQNAKTAGEVVEALKGLSPEDRKVMADFLAQLKNKQSPSGKKQARSVGSDPDGLSGVEPGGGLDETFKSWIQMEAIKKKIHQLQESVTPSDFQRRSLESAFKKGFNRLGDTLGNDAKGGLSESGFKDKFDRVLFEAARDSSDFEGDAGQDSEAMGAVGSTLDGILDRVSDVAKKNRERKQKKRKKAAEANKLKQIPLPDGEFGSEDGLGSNGSSYGTDALGAASDMLENIPELPAINLQNILIAVGIAAAVLLLLYLLFRYFSADRPSNAARKFGRSFRAAKIRSPKDLVEAVDYFIVQKFGNRAQWWNARHAQDMLCAEAPGYSAKISDLLKDYVRARYMRSDLTLSSEQQLDYKKTLQELAREVPAEQQSPADASQEEG